jgi:hypothetical protein
VAALVVEAVEHQTQLEEQAAQVSSSLNTTHLHNQHLFTVVLANG